MTHESESLKQEMSELVRGDLERARRRQHAEPAPSAEPVPAVEPDSAPEPPHEQPRFRRLFRQNR